MYHFLYPTKDSTIYEYAQDQNVGADEILELDRVSGEEARALIQFDLEYVIPLLDASSFAFRAGLRLYATEFSALPTEYTLAVYPVTEPWIRGTGRRFNEPTVSDGVTWTSTGAVPWEFSGADFDLDVRASESFAFETRDADIDVTDLVQNWVAGAENNGMIVIREGGQDTDSELKYFGGLTHTIYSPELVVSYDDSVFAPTLNQQRDPVLDPEIEQVQVQPTGVKPEYAAEGIKRFRAIARPKFQKQQFVEDASEPLRPRRFPEGTLRYRVKDALTGRVLAPFTDPASTMSFDEDGYYFDIDLRNVQPERHYELDFRYESQTGYTETYGGTDFRVTRP